MKRGKGGAEDRLAAALELQKRLEAILSGEPPFHIFVRWKPLHQQPIGWEPDINDGVRLNIRPFLAPDFPGTGSAQESSVTNQISNGQRTAAKNRSVRRKSTPWFWAWDGKMTDFKGETIFDGNRWNDCHYTNGAKQSAREAMGLLKKGGSDA